MPGKIEGEGSYEAAKRFGEAEAKFVKDGSVASKAREAEEALDGPEGEALEKARLETGARGQDNAGKPG